MYCGGSPNDNYAIAISILKERYDKPKLIVQSHIKNIFEVQSANKPPSSNLRHLTDSIKKDIACLENLNGEQILGAFFTYIVANKLDKETLEKLKMYKSNEILTVKETVEFLEQRAQFLADIDFDGDINKKAKPFQDKVQFKIQLHCMAHIKKTLKAKKSQIEVFDRKLFHQ